MNTLARVTIAMGVAALTGNAQNSANEAQIGSGKQIPAYLMEIRNRFNKVEVKYDKFDRTTQFTVDSPIPVGYNPEAPDLARLITLFALCDGKVEKCSPSQVSISLDASGSFPDERTAILADEFRIPTRPTGVAGFVFIRIADFARMCRARKVEMQTGPLEFVLSDENMTAMREFGKYINVFARKPQAR